MNESGFLQTAGPLLTVLTPLVAVPLTMITFYLRSLREQQSERQAVLSRRLDSLEAHTDDLRERMIEFERGYATKEEWLRELISARSRIERITEKTIRIEAAMLASPRNDDSDSPEPRASSPRDTPEPRNMTARSQNPCERLRPPGSEST